MSSKQSLQRIAFYESGDALMGTGLDQMASGTSKRRMLKSIRGLLRCDDKHIKIGLQTARIKFRLHDAQQESIFQLHDSKSCYARIANESRRDRVPVLACQMFAERDAI